MTASNSKLKEFRDKLNKVGRGFCLAKWSQVTIHLQQGTTHSCFHPWPHKVPLSELDIDPSALHNTSHKKEQRRKMLEGERPAECSYCWEIEDLGEDHLSDRAILSEAKWSSPFFEQIVASGHENGINPRYVEVDFGFECNLKCIYCMPAVSSRWHTDIKKNGAFNLKTTDHFLMPSQRGDADSTHVEASLYEDAFWAWWPDLCKDLVVFRITGGEPLINKNTFRVLDFLADNPMPQLEIAINSNLSISKNAFDLFIERCNKLVSTKSIKGILLHTSIEGVSEKSEYQRTGLCFSTFEKNVNAYLQRVEGGQLSFMCTYNIFSVLSFKDFLVWYSQLKDKYPDRVHLDINAVNNVDFMGIHIIPSNLTEHILDCVEYMNSSRNFTEVESSKLYSIYKKATKQCKNSAERQILLRDFYVFVTENDKRNRTDMLCVFPELQSLFAEAKNAYSNFVEAIQVDFS